MPGEQQGTVGMSEVNFFLCCSFLDFVSDVSSLIYQAESEKIAILLQ